MNQFLEKSQSKDCYTWNGAISHSTTGSKCLDYFSKAGSYRGRPQAEVNADMAAIFGEDAETALKIVFYNRMITRKCTGFVEETSVQKGQGQKDEFLKSLNWLERNRPELLAQNLWLTVEVGSWKDLVNACVEHGLDYELAFHVFSLGLENESHRGLIAKFLPKIRSKRNVKNDRHKKLNSFARAFSNYIGWSEKQYRQFKSDPENSAHQFQRDICNGNWKGLNLNAVPGKALFKMVSGKGKDQKSLFERHGLEQKLIDYVKTHPVKFTGYPHDLYKAAKEDRSLVQKYTYDAQFQTLLNKAKEDCNAEILDKGVLCALDTSGSMGYMGGYYYGGSQLQPIDVCVGLGLYFSNLIEGWFKNQVCLFDDTSRMVSLHGDFCDQVDQMKRHGNAMGGTNFQSVIDMIVRIRDQHPEIPISDYPGVLLVVSDMQHNPTGTLETNYEMAMRKLARVGLPAMQVIWWNVSPYARDMQNKKDDCGVTLLSGYDGAVLTTLFNVEKNEKGETTVSKLTPMESMIKCLDQEILNLVEV